MADQNNITPDNEYIPSEATRSSWFTVDRDYLSSIGYPTSGKGKHAQLTYQVNPAAVTITGDVSVETVSIKDGDGENRLDIINVSGVNVAPTIVVDETGTQITEFGGALLDRLGPVTNLDAVSAVGPGISVDVSHYHNFTLQVIASSGVSAVDLTVNIEHSLDGTNWATISYLPIIFAGITDIAISQTAYRYIRTNIPTYVDGVVTTYIYAGN